MGYYQAQLWTEPWEHPAVLLPNHWRYNCFIASWNRHRNRHLLILSTAIEKVHVGVDDLARGAKLDCACLTSRRWGPTWPWISWCHGIQLRQGICHRRQHEDKMISIKSFQIIYIIYIFIFVFIYIYIYVHIDIFIYIYMFIFIYIYIYHIISHSRSYAYSQYLSDIKTSRNSLMRSVSYWFLLVKVRKSRGGIRYSFDFCSEPIARPEVQIYAL